MTDLIRRSGATFKSMIKRVTKSRPQAAVVISVNEAGGFNVDAIHLGPEEILEFVAIAHKIVTEEMLTGAPEGETIQ
jgi:hypothetical protein